MPQNRVLPLDWIEYTALGQCIPGTFFIASKTPLGEKLSALLPCADCHFTPVQLFKEIKTSGYKLRKVIDITATNRYYDPKVFKAYNVEYIHVPTPGGSVPRNELLRKFVEEVKSFKERWKRWAYDRSVICVCSTHGVNRAGYFICKYLINYEGWQAEEAIRRFEEYRGHKFESQYLTEDVLSSDPSFLLKT
ncbi:DSPc domain containing protein [Trichuris trichiura]|uniref:DSPc domain containing protein n=1 Tax=Trichuris trichiura TaxID=36087 RepID=A0A077ZFN2_TRITR|nr:DSPc domain containing protein [Trichuris trichiura]